MNVDLYTTIPGSVTQDRLQFKRDLKRICTQSERYGCKGILVYSDNSLADPWVISTVILDQTRKLIPMIALQPAYMHPYTVAKKISSIALIYGRRIALNLVAGGYTNDLKALNDPTKHDERYERLTEYTEIIQQLLTSKSGVTYEGKHYQVNNLKLKPEMPDDLQPLYYLSGSSSAAKETSARLGVPVIQYPEPVDTYTHTNGSSAIEGIRIGILARHSHEKAWNDARKRFPETRNGKMMHQLAKNASDSIWHEKLSDHNGNIENGEPVYWLGPFKHYHTFCPYLVGDYHEVAKELLEYLRAGCNTCIIDTPVSELELHSTVQVFNRAYAKLEEQEQL